MGLYNNGYRLGNTPFRRGLGALVSMYNGGGTSFNYSLPTGILRSSSALFGQYAGRPVGNLHPETWMMPQKGGNMSFRPLGSGSISSSLVASYPMSINLTGAGDMDATGALVISMLLALSGSGNLTAGIQGLLEMSADFDGSGDLSAEMEGIASLAINLLGEGDLEATIAAYGNMEIDIVVTGTGLSTANIGQAVWGSVAAAYNETGTMGNKLNTASSGGVDLEALADAVWEHSSAITLNATALFLLKVVSNKKEVKKVGAVWTLIVYDNNGTTPILNKELKDIDGNNITDIAAGALAKEMASSV